MKRLYVSAEMIENTLNILYRTKAIELVSFFVVGKGDTIQAHFELDGKVRTKIIELGCEVIPC